MSWNQMKKAKMQKKNNRKLIFMKQKSYFSSSFDFDYNILFKKTD